MRYSSMHTEMAATRGQPAVVAVGDTVQVRRMAEGGCAVAVAAIDFGDPHVRDVSGAGTSISGRRERLQLSSGPAVHMISLFDPIHATLVDDFSSNERYALSASPPLPHIQNEQLNLNVYSYALSCIRCGFSENTGPYVQTPVNSTNRYTKKDGEVRDENTVYTVGARQLGQQPGACSFLETPLLPPTP